jgi:hypothetical protein
LKREQQQNSTAGIVSSDVALVTTRTGEIEVGISAGVSAAGPGGMEPTFNPFDILAGTTGGLPSRRFSPVK